MDELLGFIVLSGPLFLLVILVPLFIYVSVKLSKKFQGTKKRLIYGLAIFSSLLFLLFGDEFIRKVYLEYLCENKSGSKTYNTVVLPDKYWNDDKSPKFINTRGVLDTKMLGKRFQWNTTYEPYINTILKIKKRKWILIDNKTNVKLGENIDFTRSFGWLSNFSPAPNSGEGCGRVQIKKYGKEKYFKDGALKKHEFLLKIFKINNDKTT